MESTLRTVPFKGLFWLPTMSTPPSGRRLVQPSKMPPLLKSIFAEFKKPDAVVRRNVGPT